MRYGSNGEVKEVEVYYHDRPDSMRVYYSNDETIKKVMIKEVTHHPDGLIKSTKKVEVTHKPELYKGCTFPDLGFLKLNKFNIDQELKKRNISLVKTKKK